MLNPGTFGIAPFHLTLISSTMQLLRCHKFVDHVPKFLKLSPFGSFGWLKNCFPFGSWQEHINILLHVYLITFMALVILVNHTLCKTKLKVTDCVLTVFLVTCMFSHVCICILSVCTNAVVEKPNPAWIQLHLLDHFTSVHWNLMKHAS